MSGRRHFWDSSEGHRVVVLLIATDGWRLIKGAARSAAGLRSGRPSGGPRNHSTSPLKAYTLARLSASSALFLLRHHLFFFLFPSSFRAQSHYAFAVGTLTPVLEDEQLEVLFERLPWLP